MIRLLLGGLFAFACATACSDDDGEGESSELQDDMGSGGDAPGGAAGDGNGDGSSGGAPGGSPGEPDGGSAPGDGSGGTTELPAWDRPLYGEEGTPPDDLRLVFREIDVPGVSSATDIAFLPPGDDLAKSSLLMLSRDNFLHLVDLEGGEASVRKSWDFDDGGYLEEACVPTNVLLGPDFEDSGFVFITKCAELETTQLLRFRFDAEEGLSNRRVIFETTHPDTNNGWHRMGSMGWETDDILWMLVGDHSDQLPNDSSQDVTTPLGAMLRIIPNREPGGTGHEYPSGNYVDRPSAPEDAHPAIFAYGLRSPWRGTRDRAGRVYVGDVGLESFEEVNLVVEAGQNFGWNEHEGVCEADCDGFVDPIVTYDRDSEHPYVEEEPMAGGSGQRAIWVGETYEEPAVDRYEGMMDGVVPFGDLFVNFVRGLSADQEGQVTFDAPIGLLSDVTSWKVAPDGYAYAVDLFGNLHVALLDYETGE